MKKLLASLILLGLTSVMFAGTPDFPGKKPNEFVGTKKCGMCHKKEKDGSQLVIWKKSGHAKAYETLKNEKSAQVMKDLGLEGKAYENEKCLKCHAPAKLVDKKLLDKKFKVEDGVQCENCHGAGSNYKSKKTMENREKAVENGLIVFADDAAIEKMCVTCHNEESPTYKPFNFKERWAEIKHYVPKN